MHLAVSGLFGARWSAAVHEEWISNLLINRPDLTRRQLDRTRMLMDKHAGEAVVTGYEHLMNDLPELPDPGDRHVVAAAIHGRAGTIVTMNLKDFPAKIIEPLGLTARHPDGFILDLFGLAPEVVIAAARAHRESLKNPSKTVDEYLEMLERQGLTESVAVLRTYKL